MSRYYAPSGRFEPVRLLVAAPVAFAVAGVIAAVYAFISYHMPFVYVNLVLAAGFAAALGVLATQAARVSRTRNGKVAALLGFLVIGAGYYYMWAVWAGFVYEDRGRVAAYVASPDALYLATHPRELWTLITAIADVGAWKFMGGWVAGGLLWTVWAVEALIVLGLGSVVAGELYRDATYCEACGAWGEKAEGVAKLRHYQIAALSQYLEHGRDEVLLSAALEDVSGDGAWYRLDIQSCPCGALNAVDLVTVRADEQGKPRTGETALENLLIDAALADRLRAARPLAPAAT